MAALVVPPATAQIRESRAQTSAAVDLLEAKILLGEGQYRKALKTLRVAVSKEPGDPYLRLELAKLAARLGRMEEAAEHAETALEGAPEDPDVLFVVGEVFQRLAARDPEYGDRARTVLEQALEAAPADVQALHALGRQYQRQGDLEAAEETFRRLMALQPGERTATFLLQTLLDLGKEDAARELLREVLDQDPEALEMRFTLADLLAEAGRGEEALEVLQAAPEEQALEPELVRRIVGVLLREDRSEEARERLEAAVRENQGSDRLKLYLGLLLADLGEVGDARELLSRYLEANPHDLEAARALVRLEVQDGRPREAVRVVRRVAGGLESEDPDSAAGLVQASMRLLARAGRWSLVVEAASMVPEAAPRAARLEILRLEVEGLRRLERHREALDRLDASALEGPEVQAIRAELLFEIGEEDRARELLASLESSNPRLAARVYQGQELYGRALPLWQRVVEDDPDSLQARFSLAAALERTGRFQEATEMFRNLLRESPDFHLALNYLGYMWAERGQNLDEAQSLVERALELDPGNGAYVDSLGWIFYQKGEYEKALSQLRRAADLLPRDGTVQEHLGDVLLALGNASEARAAYLRALELQDDGGSDLHGKLKDAERRERGGTP